MLFSVAYNTILFNKYSWNLGTFARLACRGVRHSLLPKPLLLTREIFVCVYSIASSVQHDKKRVILWKILHTRSVYKTEYNSLSLIEKYTAGAGATRSHTILLGAGAGAGATKIQVAPHPW